MTNEQFKRLKEAIKSFKKWKLFKIIFLLISIIIGVSTLFYTIPSESVGVVMRFGKYSSTTDPGLHLKLPFFIDQVEKVPVRRQLKQEFGFGTAGATNYYQYSNPNTQQAEDDYLYILKNISDEKIQSQAILGMQKNVERV